MIPSSLFFFFNDPATTEIYTLSLHDALPIFQTAEEMLRHRGRAFAERSEPLAGHRGHRAPAACPREGREEPQVPGPHVVDVPATEQVHRRGVAEGAQAGQPAGRLTVVVEGRGHEEIGRASCR